MMQLSVRLVPVGDTTLVIALTGELDSTTVPVLAAFLDPLPQSPVKYVVVAAGDLWFCDLNGLKQLSITHRALLAKGGHLAVAEAQPPLSRLIGLMTTQVQPGIPVYNSMPEALASTDVEVYETTAAPTPVPRHLPSLRGLAGKQSLGAAPRVRPSARLSIRQDPPRPPPAPVPQPPIIDQAKILYEQITHQRRVLTRQLDLLSETRLLVSSARERCGDSLKAMRTNLTIAQSVATPTMWTRPVNPTADGHETDQCA
jgi:anti-anti-sigma factor